MLSDQIKQSIKDICLQDLSKESCGFVVSRVSEIIVLQVKNISENPVHFFEIAPADYVKAERMGEIIHIFHSHNSDVLDFSEFDKKNSERLKIPYILYCTKTDEFKQYVPQNYINKYENREFVFGKTDCFNLIIDYYREQKNMIIPNFLSDRDALWNNRITDLLGQFLDRTPLKETHILEQDSILVLDYKNNRYHFAIYLGNDLILHHPRDSKSIIEPLDTVKRKLIRYILVPK